ncbi:hypothetical protein [Arthrobacter sp. ISL-69]|uniref:hypothetical protein n=1 Tax=Arthrobacter sp. ISL-69 TaxID=2819113 RepID=UPI001BE7FFDC|nr:hypothetical protein [Arthrobacter sp. ISL-69]MBT2536049.1 hypothetical protein [Arthrobacter sp. ISL-69]
MRGNQVFGCASVHPHHQSRPLVPAAPLRDGAGTFRSGGAADDTGGAPPAPPSTGPNDSLPMQPGMNRRRPPDQRPDGVVAAADLDELLLEEIERLTAELKGLAALYVSLRSAPSISATARAVDLDQTLERMAAKALDIQIVSRHAFLRRQWPSEESAWAGEFNQESELGKAE